METQGKVKYIRVSPQKIRPITRAINKMLLDEAIKYLKFIEKKNAVYIIRLLESVRANAQIINPDVKTEKIYIKGIRVDEGPTMKRFRIEARGRVHRIKKRTSHITVFVADEEGEK